jgi:hypothetical protein
MAIGHEINTERQMGADCREAIRTGLAGSCRLLSDSPAHSFDATTVFCSSSTQHTLKNLGTISPTSGTSILTISAASNGKE